MNHTCEDPNQTCNCDVKESKWFADEGYYSSAQSLGITNMYFLRQKDLDEEAKGRITLGPLECVETSMFIILKFCTSRKNRNHHNFYFMRKLFKLNHYPSH